MRRSAALLVLIASLLALAPLASGAATQTTLNDVEDEVMCPICGTLLELSEAPQAQRERAYIAGLIAAGKTKAEVKDALVVQYGPAVLALPGDSGFDLSAYLAPLIAFFAAVIALAFGLARWRAAATGSPESTVPSAPEGEQAERLEDDLARYDL